MDELNNEDVSDGSWGSDFDDETSEYYREIQDNKINESLEAQLVKDTSVNVTDGNAISSCHEGRDIITENTYSNVISPSTSTKSLKGFSYLVNNNNVNMLRNAPNQNAGSVNGAIPKSAVSISETNDVSKIVNGSQPKNDGSVSTNMKPFVSEKPRTIGNKFPQQVRNFPIMHQNRNSRPEDTNTSPEDTSGTSQEPRTRSNDIVPNKTPRRLRPEAFSFLKVTDEITDDSAAKRNELVNRVKKNIVSPTAFVHAVQLSNQNTPEKENVGSTMETYEWSVPSLSSSNTPEMLDHAKGKTPGNINITLANNIPVTGETKPVKPPLPSRPPPVFMYPSETFISKNEKPVREKLVTSSARSTEKCQSEIGATLASPSVPANNFIQSAVKLPSNYIDSKNENEDQIIQKIPTNILRPLPPKPTPVYPLRIIPKKTSRNTKGDSGIQILHGIQLPVATPLQTVERRQEGKDFNQSESSDVEILSQKFVATPIVNVGKPQLPQRKSLDSSVRTDCGLEKEFGSPKVARFLSTPHQDKSNETNLANEETSRQKVNDFEQIRENIDPASVLDEIRLNAIHRPSLPERLLPSQKSRSYSSLVQSLKEIGFPKRNQSDKNKYWLADATEKPSKDAVGKIEEKKQPTDIRKLPSGSSNAEDSPIIDSKPQLWKNNADFSSQKDIIMRFAWFHDVEAKEASRRLMSMKQDGAFLIRSSTNPTPEQPYTACVSFAGRVINLHIRHLTNGYALGKHKEGEKVFFSLSDMIKYHQDVPVEIRTAGQTNPGNPSWSAPLYPADPSRSTPLHPNKQTNPSHGHPSSPRGPPPLSVRFLVTPPK